MSNLLRRNASRRLKSGLSARFFMSAPRSSSASARSLCLMSTPLTRATTGSAAEAGASDDVSFEQPDAASTVNSTAAMAAYPIGRLCGGEWGSTLWEVMGVILDQTAVRRAGQ